MCSCLDGVFIQACEDVGRLTAEAGSAVVTSTAAGRSKCSPEQGGWEPEVMVFSLVLIVPR